MKSWKEKLIRIARENVLVRGALIVYCFCYYLWRDLGRLLLVRKRQAVACMMVIVLAMVCLKGSFSSAWEEQIRTGQVSGGDAGSTEGFDSVSEGDAGPEEEGSGDMGEEDGAEEDGSVSGGDAAPGEGEGAGDNGSVSGGDAAPGEGGDAGDNGSVSGGDAAPGEGGSAGDNGSVSGGDADFEGPDKRPEDAFPVVKRMGETLKIDCQGADYLDGIYVGASDLTFSVAAAPIEEERAGIDYERQIRWEDTKIIGICYSYDGEEASFEEGRSLLLTVSESCFKSLYLWGVDDYGHQTEVYRVDFWIDRDGPEIRMDEIELADGRKYLHVEMEDAGEAASGISGLECTVNGEAAQIENYEALQTCTSMLNLEGIKVLSYDVVLDVDVVNEVAVRAWDELGNESAYEAEVRQNIILDVDVPDEIGLCVSPWMQDIQISSTPVVITNNSAVDVELTVSNVKVEVLRTGDETKEQKSCSILLEAEAPGQEVAPAVLFEGESGSLFTIRIPGRESADPEDCKISLVMSGNVTDGSENMWKSGDLKVNILLNYRPARKRR